MDDSGGEKFKAMGIVVGGTYNVFFDVDAREYKGRWYNEIQAWRAMRLDGQQQGQQQGQQTPVAPQPQPRQGVPMNNGGDDDLPW